jgi:hypothetical protein
VTAKTIGESAGAMDAFRFAAKLDHEVILERSRYQSAGLVETMTIFA